MAKLSTNYIIVLATCPNQANASEIATSLVQERLAACVNILPGVTSVYRWQGKLETEQECQLIIKTREQRFDQVAAKITELHPYDTPEIIALEVTSGADQYLQFITDNT